MVLAALAEIGGFDKHLRRLRVCRQKTSFHPHYPDIIEDFVGQPDLLEFDTARRLPDLLIAQHEDSI